MGSGYPGRKTMVPVDWREALDTARKLYTGRRRRSGLPAWSHPFMVYYLSAIYGLGGNHLASALLHDVLEDGLMDPQEIEEEYGRQVLRSVMILTREKRSEDPEDLQLYWVGFEGRRTELIIKTADIFANLYDSFWSVHDINKQQKKFRELKEYYLPLIDILWNGNESLKASIICIAALVT